jgi:hypothetical protein
LCEIGTGRIEGSSPGMSIVRERLRSLRVTVSCGKSRANYDSVTPARPWPLAFVVPAAAATGMQIVVLLVVWVLGEGSAR